MYHSSYRNLNTTKIEIHSPLNSNLISLFFLYFNSIDGVDEDNELIYFSGNKFNHTQQQLFVSSFSPEYPSKGIYFVLLYFIAVYNKACKGLWLSMDQIHFILLIALPYIDN